MQFSALIALLPLLALTSAAPACNRKADVDLSSNRGGRWSQGGPSRWREEQQAGLVDDVKDRAPAPAPPVSEPEPELEPQPQTQPAPDVAPVMEDSKDTFTTVPMPDPAPSPAPATDDKDTAASLPPSPSSSPSPSPAPVEDEPQPAPIADSKELVAPAPSTNSNGKIGLAMDWSSKANVGSFDGKIGWYYSWGLNTLPGTEGLEFVPMIHHASVAREFDGNVPAGSTHMLSFNEPDIDSIYGGSNMSPAEAADLHKLWTGKVPSSIKIGSPSVARGGQKWMDDWLAACGGACRFDFVPYHYYGTDANDLIRYTKEFYAHFKKPLWLTEFACHDYGTGHICTPAEVESFMKTFFTWADSAEGKGMVERWSWFGAFPNHAPANANGILSADGSANAMGKLYASF